MNTSDHRPDMPLERRARELFHEAARQIDPVTAGRLRSARRQALESARSASRRPVRWLIPAGAGAAIVLAALMVWRPLPHHGAPSAVPAASSADGASALDGDLPPDADQTDPNLYQDLDFYGWLAANGNPPEKRGTP